MSWFAQRALPSASREGVFIYPGNFENGDLAERNDLFPFRIAADFSGKFFNVTSVRGSAHMFRISLPLSALRDKNFTPQMQLDALEHAYCRAFSLLDECELPTSVDVELRRRLDVLLALALGINMSMMPADQFEVTDMNDPPAASSYGRDEDGAASLSSLDLNDSE